MKKCTKCNKILPVDKFYARSKDRLRSECKECYTVYCKEYRNKNKEKYKERWRKWYNNNKGYYCKNKERIKDYSKEWYKKNKDHFKAYDRDRRYERTKILSEIKVKKGCIDCGYNIHPAALDFDHIRDKHFQISDRKSCSMDRLLGEIGKCEVRCANCHRIATYNRRVERQ